LDTDYDTKSIIDTVMKCIQDKKFRENCMETDNPYYLGNAGEKIAEVLAQVSLDTHLIRKKMTLHGECDGGWYR